MESRRPNSRTADKSPYAWRVFLSSTFRDMAAERDELIRRVFPRLRRRCEERSVTLCEVDLRWGIPTEDALEGRVLALCLDEIERCRPFFVCLLGDHYGSLVGELLPAASAHHPGTIPREPLVESCRDRSVTELEILRAVLAADVPVEHAFFYFRADRAPEPGSTPPRPASVAKLAALKDQIRRSGLPLRENYQNAEELGRWVFEDLAALLERLHPAKAGLSLAARSREANRAFAAKHSNFHLLADNVLRRLKRHAKRRSGPPLVIGGGAGSGKSALLGSWTAPAFGLTAPALSTQAGAWTAWLSRFRVSWQSKAKPAEVLAYFIEASPDGADWRSMLDRLEEGLAPRAAQSIQSPPATEVIDAGTRRETFVHLLRKVPVERHLVIVLDGLDHLDEEGTALRWLPEAADWPAHVRLVVSAGPGRAADELAARGWPVLEMHPFEPQMRTEFARGYLTRYGKRLGPTHEKMLVTAPATSNALYLKTVLDELRFLGDHSILGERIEDYLAAASPAALYEKVLVRIESQAEEPALLTRALRLLWSARHGLTESELLDLLGDTTGADLSPLPALRWSPINLALRGLLLERTGLFVLENRALRSAVERRHVPTAKAAAPIRRRLADYFAAREFSPRSVAETPWQLTALRDWEGLYSYLTRPECLRQACTPAGNDLRVCWTVLERASAHRLVNALQPVVADPAAFVDLVPFAAQLLLERAYVQEARILTEFQVAQAGLAQNAGNESKLANAFHLQARALRACGDLEAALASFREEESHLTRIEDGPARSACLTNQGTLLRESGDLDKAMACLRKAETLSSKLRDRRGLVAALGGQAAILFERGDFAAALARWEAEGSVCEETGDVRAWGYSLGNQALAQTALGRLTEAHRLHQAEEKLLTRLGDPVALQACLGNQAVVRQRQADFDGAMDLLDRREAICRGLESKGPLIETRLQQALLFAELPGLKAGARSCLEEAESLTADSDRVSMRVKEKIASVRQTILG